MNCIVCDGIAEQIEPSSRGALGISCDTCGAYEISGIARAVLSKRSAYAKLQALRFAQTQADAGRRPYIHGEA